jgi:hypothetical protein
MPFLAKVSEHSLQKMYLSKAKTRIGQTAPNTACTRLVGVCAFSGSSRGLRLVPAKWHPLVPPTSG